MMKLIATYGGMMLKGWDWPSGTAAPLAGFAADLMLVPRHLSRCHRVFFLAALLASRMG